MNPRGVWAPYYDQLLERCGDRIKATVQEARLKGNIVVRQYGGFGSWFDFYRYQNEISPEKRNYFESVLGELPQKPHFDIDLDRKKHRFTFRPEELIDALVYSIVQTMGLLGVALRLDQDILLFSSHGPDKFSFHLIIDNWYHRNNLEAKEFHRRVLTSVPAQFLQESYIDPAVYSSFQQFRIIGNRKAGTTRTKQFLKEWSYNKNLIVNSLDDHKQIFLHSLIGYTPYCSPLPLLESNAPIDNYQELPDDYAKFIDQIPNEQYSYKKVKGNMVILERIRSGYCQICEREHEHENAYIVANKGEVLFYCRRNKKAHRLGYLQPKASENVRSKMALLAEIDLPPLISKKEIKESCLDRIYHGRVH